MNITDPRFLLALAAPVTFRGVGPFGAVRVQILDTLPGFATGYRFRPLVDRRAEDAPDPVWVELPSEWFAADNSPSEARAAAVIEAFLAGPSPEQILADAKAALIARATHRRWEVECGGIVVGGMPVTTDDRSKTLLMQADRGARLYNLGTRWKGTDGVWIPLTADQVKDLAAAVDAHVRACFVREEQLHDLIHAAEDLAALEALKPDIEAFVLAP